MLLFFDKIFHHDVHYVCMLVQRFEPQGRRFTNVHYYNASSCNFTTILGVSRALDNKANAMEVC